LHSDIILGSYERQHSLMKLDSIFSSETSVNLYLTTGCPVTQDTNTPSHCLKNLALRFAIQYVVKCTVDVHEAVHPGIIVKITNKIKLYRLIYYSKSALHVSGVIFAHHQEHLSIFRVSGSVHPSR